MGGVGDLVIVRAVFLRALIGPGFEAVAAEGLRRSGDAGIQPDVAGLIGARGGSGIVREGTGAIVGIVVVAIKNRCVVRCRQIMIL